MLEGLLAALIGICIFIGGISLGIKGEDKVIKDHCDFYQKHEIDGKVYECHILKENQ